MLATAGRGAARRRPSTRWSPATCSTRRCAPQTLDDLAANRYGTELPPSAGERRVRRRGVGRRPPRGRRGADRAARDAGARGRAGRGRPGATCSTRSRCRCCRCWRDMELAGVTIDQAALAAMARSSATSSPSLEARIYELVGHPFNIGSPKQLEQILFDELELPAHEAHADRLLDGCIGPGGAARQARGDRPDPRAPPGVEAEVAPTSTRCRCWRTPRAGAHHLLSRRWPPPGGCRAPIRTSRTSRSAPRSAAASGGAFVAPAGQAAARRRLLAAGAAHPGPRLRRRGPEGGLRGALRTSTWPPPPRVLGLEAEQVGPQERSVAKMINYGIAYGLSRLRPGATGCGSRSEEAHALHRRLLRRLPGDPPLHGRDADPGPRPGLRHARSSDGAATCRS